MATLPSYVCIEQGGWSEAASPSVERVEMDRGPAKQRLVNSRRFPQVTATFVFKSRADAIAFEDWYDYDILGIGWFDMIHPLRGTTIQARFVGGDIGELTPRGRGFDVSSRTVTLEYLR